MKNENKYWNLENSEERLNLILNINEFWDWIGTIYNKGIISNYQLNYILGLESPSPFDFVLQYNELTHENHFEIVHPTL